MKTWRAIKTFVSISHCYWELALNLGEMSWCYFFTVIEFCLFVRC